MEELRSTEILDKEIQEDARKKAERILQDAGIEASKIKEEIDSRVEAAKKEKEAVFTDKLELFKRDAEAALPLEKKRFLVAFEGKQMAEHARSYLAGLSPDKRDVLLGRLLERSKSAIEKGQKVHASVFGMQTEEVKKLLTKTLGSDAVGNVSETAFEKTGEVSGEVDIRSGFILETADRAVRLRITLAEVAGEVFDTSREELADALFGGRLPQ